MSKKNIIAKVGNFEISKDCGPEHDYLRIKSISGDWGISFRDDNPMYGFCMMLCRTPEHKKGLEVFVVMAHSLTSSLPDKEFVSDYFNALGALRQRMVTATPEVGEEENDEAAKEALVIENLSKANCNS